jgi:long-chain acyl-CoA synthetase
MAEETILHQLLENGRVRPNAHAYLVRDETSWIPTTWEEYARQVTDTARALIALGMEPGESVCILGFNRPDWVIFDLASMLVGGHAAGIYSTSAPADIEFIINDSGAHILLIENEYQWKKVIQIRDQIPNLKYVILMKGAQIEDKLTLDWNTFTNLGEQVEREQIEARLHGLKMDQLATLIYTSGTTGPPKGVMLSHRNLAWTAKQGIELFDIRPSDSVLSYLPLSHIAEQMFTVHTAIMAGYKVYFAQFPPQKHLNSNFKEVQPTIVFGVPRVWERFAEGITSTLSEYSGLKAKVADWAQSVGRRVSNQLNQGKRISVGLGLLNRLADRLVFARVREALGFSHVRYCLSGAAPIAAEVIQFFNSLGIPLMEIYGQSEDSGPTTVNRPGANRIGTVGQAWPGTEVRLADDGEVLVRGPNVFMGYYNNPDATASDLVDGWLYTGDLGQFDDDGYLTIIGRKKEIIITSGGQNIAPKNIEAALMNLPLVSQAVCIGDKRRYIAALLTLNTDAAGKLVGEGLESVELHTHPTVVGALSEGIDEQVNPLLSRAEHVREFCILARDFSLDEGELTPTLKIKRRVIYERYAVEIESMYTGSMVKQV